MSAIGFIANYALYALYTAGRDPCNSCTPPVFLGAPEVRRQSIEPRVYAYVSIILQFGVPIAISKRVPDYPCCLESILTREERS